MKSNPPITCAICGEPRWGGDGWFLLAESHWQDRLKILEWNDHLAAQPGICCACSALHVEQLVIHWMTAGSLNHPFAIPPSEQHPKKPRGERWASEERLPVDTAGSRLIGELAVHRESMLRILNDSPQSLTAIMEALVSALRKNPHRDPNSLDCDELELCSPHREI